MVKSVPRRPLLLAGAAVLAGAALWPATHDALLLRVRRTGGIAGADDTVVIWESGRVLVARRPPVRTVLTRRQHALLRAALAAADFAHLPARHRAGGADMYGYRVEHGHWSVVTNAPHELPGLSEVLRVPEEVMRAYR